MGDSRGGADIRIALVLSLVLTACIAGGRPPPGERDERLLREVARQQRWAQDAVDARPSSERLARIRSGDYGAVADGRRDLRKLVTAADRATWSRDALADAVRGGEADPQLLREFERAAQLRTEALAGADELALALAQARGALAPSDLRPAFQALQRARRSEAALERQLAGAPAGSPVARLATAPLPSPAPFTAAAAHLLRARPDAAKELDSLAGEDAPGIRAAAAALPASAPAEAPEGSGSASSAAEEAAPAGGPPAPGEEAGPPPPSPGSPLRSPAKGAGETATSALPTRTLRIAGDARALFAKRGPPRAVEARPDGTFALRYDEQRACGPAQCAQVDYVFDAAGKSLREEPVKP